MSKARDIALVMNIDPNTGWSREWDIADLEAYLGYPLHGNGSAYLQDDRGVGLTYKLKKTYTRGPGKAIATVQAIGKV